MYERRDWVPWLDLTRSRQNRQSGFFGIDVLLHGQTTYITQSKVDMTLSIPSTLATRREAIDFCLPNCQLLEIASDRLMFLLVRILPP